MEMEKKKKRGGRGRKAFQRWLPRAMILVEQTQGISTNQRPSRFRARLLRSRIHQVGGPCTFVLWPRDRTERSEMSFPDIPPSLVPRHSPSLLSIFSLLPFPLFASSTRLLSLLHAPIAISFIPVHPSSLTRNA